MLEKVPHGAEYCHAVPSSATTLVSVRNTRVLQMALTALTAPRTLWLRITCYLSPRRRIALHTYFHHFVVTFMHHQRDTCVSLFAGAAIMLKPFTQRLAMLNHSYYLSLNEFQNICIQFVFSSMYLYIYIATYLHTVYLNWQHTVIVSNLTGAWRWRSSELRDTLRGRHRASLERQLMTVIEWTQRCSGRPWWSEVGDELWGRDRARLERQLETEIEWTRRFTPSCVRVSFEMHLQQAMIEGD